MSFPFHLALCILLACPIISIDTLSRLVLYCVVPYHLLCLIYHQFGYYKTKHTTPSRVVLCTPLHNLYHNRSITYLLMEWWVWSSSLHVQNVQTGHFDVPYHPFIQCHSKSETFGCQNPPFFSLKQNSFSASKLFNYFIYFLPNLGICMMILLTIVDATTTFET